MAQQITLAPAWCDNHLAQCWHSYNHQTGITSHLGNPEGIQPAELAKLGAEFARLKELGYIIAHRSGTYTATRYTSQPLALPLDWQMALESREPEYIDIDQDW